MNATLQRIHALGARAWLLILQWLNALAGSFFGMVVVLNAEYPALIRDVTHDLPPGVQLAIVGAFCLLVHYAAKRAKKAV